MKKLQAEENKAAAVATATNESNSNGRSSIDKVNTKTSVV